MKKLVFFLIFLGLGLVLTASLVFAQNIHEKGTVVLQGGAGIGLVGLPAHAQDLPEFYGIYLKQGNSILDFKEVELTFIPGISIGNIATGIYGIHNLPNTRLEDPSQFEILIYDQQISPDTVRLSELIRLASAPANFFDKKPTKTNPNFFRNVYGVDYNTKIKINLWVVDHDISLKIAPVAAKPGMYRLIPEETLSTGVYAVNFGSIGGPRYYIGKKLIYPFIVGQITNIDSSNLIVMKEAKLRSRPASLLSKVLAIVPMGTKVVAIDKDSNDYFIKVRLSSGEEGWIDRKALAIEKEH